MTIQNDVNWHGGGKKTVGNGPELIEVEVATEQGEYSLLALPWEVAYDLAIEADNVFEEIDAKSGLGVELWWPWGDDGDQTDENTGSTDDDPEPTETEEGGDDDGRDNDTLDASLDFDRFLADARAAAPKRPLTAQERRDFNYGWDSFFFARVPAAMNAVQRAGYEASRVEHEAGVIAERQLFAQTVHGAPGW